MRMFLLSSLLVGVLTVPLAYAGNPHFVACTVDVTGPTITAEGKEAGLGNVSQVHIVLTAEAACINPGGHHPTAANKEAVAAEGDFPVQNGKALFSLEATPSFQPTCSPPMSIELSHISVCDVEHDVCCLLE